MKLFFMVAIIVLMSLPFQASAAETFTESMQDLENDTRREAKQKLNRLEEAACMKSETECLEEKAKNRMEEASDAIADKYEEIINVIDKIDFLIAFSAVNCEACRYEINWPIWFDMECLYRCDFFLSCGYASRFTMT